LTPDKELAKIKGIERLDICTLDACIGREWDIVILGKAIRPSVLK